MDMLTRATDAPMHIGPCAPTGLIIREASTSREFTFKRIAQSHNIIEVGRFLQSGGSRKLLWIIMGLPRNMYGSENRSI